MTDEVTAERVIEAAQKRYPRLERWTCCREPFDPDKYPIVPVWIIVGWELQESAPPRFLRIAAPTLPALLAQIEEKEAHDD